VRLANRTDQSGSGAESEQLITLREAARRIGLGLRQLDRACAHGELALYRVGGWRRVRWLDVEAWLNHQRATTTSQRSPLPWTLRAAERYLAALDNDIELARVCLDVIEARS
jgi:excisionase family DNA binding protein